MPRKPSRRSPLAGILAAMLSAPAMAQTLFFEDFQTRIDPGSGQPVMRCEGPGGPGTYPFPDGWRLRNVDNRAPNAQVAYVNEAWEVREDFQNNVLDCVAFSTSYYTPVGPANDWMWTPLIGPLPQGSTTLSWDAKNYDPNYQDGYEVRIMTAALGPPTGGTGVVGNQVTSSTVVFSTLAEAATWTTRLVDISAYAGQSIYVGFRNPSNDKFLLVLDDIKVENVQAFDPELLSVSDTPTQGFAKVPAALAFGFDLQAQVRNSGANALTSIVVEADLLVDGVVVDTLTSSAIPTLAPNASQTVTIGGSAYTDPGTWSVEALVTATEGDDIPDNSVLSVELTEVTANELTRAQGEAISTIGIGAGTSGELGQDFQLPGASKLQAARFGIVNVDQLPAPDGDGIGDFNGYTMEARLRGWNVGEDEPGGVVATGTLVVPAEAEVGPLTLAFDFGGQVLPPGRYLLSLVEPTAPQPIVLTLQTMLQRYTPGTGWAIWPSSPFGGWANIEAFGPGYQRALAVTAVLELLVTVPVAQPDAFQVPHLGTFAGDVSLNDTPSDDGGNIWTVTKAPASGTLLMQPTGAFEYIPAPGTIGSTVTFDYSLCDVDEDCSTAEVELAIILTDAIFADSFE